MTSKPITDDESPLAQHTGALAVGRVRPVTIEESESREIMFRANAVLALTGPVPADVGAFEQHVASLIDGVRPVARIRSKSGVSSADLRIALASLCDRHLLRLAGIVIESAVTVKESVRPPDGETGSRPDLIPTHVMMEIAAMMDEDEPA
jgi:hypothetical protein